MCRSIRVCLGLACICALALMAVGCTSKVRSQGAKATTKLLFPVSEIPGDYYFGDGLGVNCTLCVKTNHRFTFEWRGCLGVYDSNEGSWGLDGDVLVLHPKKPCEQKGFRGMDIRYVPVKWGSDYFLVDENGMPGFCATASTDGSPGDRPYGDYRKERKGALPNPNVGPMVPAKLRGVIRGIPMPVIPIRFREFYEKGPVRATIVGIAPDGQVTLNRGSAGRVRPGMLLAAMESEPINLQVVSAATSRSVAKPIYFWNSDRRAKIGDRFTTGESFTRPRGTGSRRFDAPPDESRHSRN